MPWNDAQVRLFAAAAHNPAIAKSSGIPADKARQMEMEASSKQRSKAMKGAKPQPHHYAQALSHGRA